MVDQEQLEELRIFARIVAHRARANEAFKEQLLQDPVETLTDAGLPENAISDFLREVTADVAGYMCTYTCLQTYVQ